MTDAAHAPGAAHGDTPGGAPDHAPGGDLWAALAQARAQHQGQATPAWQRIDALARRTQAHSGSVRTLLEARLHQLLRQLPAQAPAAPASPPPTAMGAAQPVHPLRQLLHRLQSHAEPPPAAEAADVADVTDAAPPAADRPAAPAPLPELKAVQQHRHTWARLRATQRVAQSRTALPPQAGPMNTQRLLHQALLFMHATSPGYLQHFSTQAEALMWLENTLNPNLPAPAVPRKTRKR